MWRLTPIAECGQPPGELEEIVGKLYRPGDGIPNFFKLLAKSRASLLAYVRAEEALANGLLSTAQRERIALAVAEINGSDYCIATHTRNGRKAGLSDAEMQSALKATATDRKTEAMLHFVQAVVLQRGEVSDGDFSALRKVGFSEAEIIEVLADAVLNIFSNYFNILARTDLDCSPSQANEKNHPVGKNVRETKR